MSCPDTGVLRAVLDRQPEAREAQAHLAACADCQRLATELAARAEQVAAAIQALAPRERPSPMEIAAARARARRRLAMESGASKPTPTLMTRTEHGNMARTQRSRRWRAALAGLAAALVLVFLVGTPMGRGAAAQFLAQFRTERLAVVEFDPRQHQTLFDDLEHLGTVELKSQGTEQRTVDSVAEASRRVGFPVQQPDPSVIPDGLDKQPTVAVMPATQVRFRFDRARADAYLQSKGSDLRLPANFDGAALVLNIPAAAVLQYQQAAPSDGRTAGPPLVIGQAGSFTADTEGNVALEQVREFLLDLPGLSPATRRQLRAIDDWRSTLPIPVPVDEVHWRRARIAGSDGLLLEDRSGLGSAAVWLRDGRVYGVFGPLDGDQVQRIANSLR